MTPMLRHFAVEPRCLIVGNQVERDIAAHVRFHEIVAARGAIQLVASGPSIVGVVAGDQGCLRGVAYHAVDQRAHMLAMVGWSARGGCNDDERGGEHAPKDGAIRPDERAPLDAALRQVSM